MLDICLVVLHLLSTLMITHLRVPEFYLLEFNLFHFTFNNISKSICTFIKEMKNNPHHTTYSIILCNMSGACFSAFTATSQNEKCGNINQASIRVLMMNVDLQIFKGWCKVWSAFELGYAVMFLAETKHKFNWSPIFSSILFRPNIKPYKYTVWDCTALNDYFIRLLNFLL